MYNFLLAVIICVILIFSIYLFYGYCFFVSGGKQLAREIFNGNQWLFGSTIIAFSLLGLCFVYYTIEQNHFVYYWDYSGYWTLCISQMDAVFAEPLEAFGALVQSIKHDEYNLLLPTLLALPLKVFGVTYTHYILIIYVLFLVPTFLIISFAGFRIIATLHQSIKSPFLAWSMIYMFAVFFPRFYYPMLRGYVDVACLIPSALLILLITDWNPLVKLKDNLQKNISISLLLILSMLFRRYFAYFVVGFVVGAIALTAYVLIQPENRSCIKASLKNIFLNFLFLGIFSLAILLLFFSEFLFRSISTDYASQYVAYNLPLLDKISGLSSRFGYILIPLILASIAIPIYKNKNARQIIFLSIFSVCVPTFFFGVQRMDQHHSYTITNQIFLLVVIGIFEITALLHFKRIVFSVLTAVYALNFLTCYIQPIRNFFPDKLQLIFAEQYLPLQRNDITQLQNLKNHLNQLASDSSKSIYVTASGNILNCDILRSLDKPYSLNAVNNLLPTADIDLRDGFPKEFLSADIIVATNPVQLHAAEGTQEVVRFLNTEVLNQSSPIGKHFQPENIFYLDNNTQAIVLFKTSAFDSNDLQYIADYFSSYYPGQSALFYDRILSQ